MIKEVAMQYGKNYFYRQCISEVFPFCSFPKYRLISVSGTWITMDEAATEAS
jgi:hypothetical protein